MNKNKNKNKINSISKLEKDLFKTLNIPSEVLNNNNKNDDKDDLKNFINSNTFNGNLVITYSFHPSQLQSDINQLIKNYYYKYNNNSYYLFYVRNINNLVKQSYGEIDLKSINVKIILNVEYKLYRVDEVYSAKINFQITTNEDGTFNLKFEAHTNELFIELKYDTSKIILNNNKITIRYNSNKEKTIDNNDTVNVRLTEIKQLQKEDGFIDKLYCKGELI